MDKKFIQDNIKRFNKRVEEIGDGKFVSFWGSFVYCAVRHGASPDDFFRYEFYRKSDLERSKFITYRKSQKLIKTSNDKKEVPKLFDKVIFNKEFSNFVRREWLDTETCTLEQFVEFIQAHKTVIVKPISAGAGTGIWKYEYKNGDDLKELLQSIKGSLVEEQIKQHPLLNELNPWSVNSIRVMAVTNNGQVNIVACTLRTGINKGVVDNLHSGGASATVDIETGMVIAPARNVKLEKFLVHPITGKKYVGFTVPHWDKVLGIVREAALTVPSIQYVGWDVAVLEDGVELIEGNHDGSHDVFQMIDQVGKYKLVKKHLS